MSTSRYFVEGVCEVRSPLGTVRAIEGAEVYLFAFGTGTTHTEPSIPTGTAVSGNFYDADTGGNQLNATHAWGPITTDANGYWFAYFATYQRVDVVYSSNNGAATYAGTGLAADFAQFKDVEDVSSGNAAAGGTTTVAVNDDADALIVNASSIKVVGANLSSLSAEAILNFLGGYPRDYVVFKDTDSNWKAKRRDANQFLYSNSDPIATIQAIDTAVVSGGNTVGVSVAIVGDLVSTTTTGLLIASNGFHMYGGGYGASGDPMASRLYMSAAATGPYAGGLGTTPFITWQGYSGGIHGMAIDAQEKARKALYNPPNGGSGYGRHISIENSLIDGGTDYTVDLQGDDSFIRDCEFHMNVGGDGTHGVAVYHQSGADINCTSLHCHGSGVGASGRVAIIEGQTNKYVGVHFESGNSNSNQWVVEAGGEKTYFTGCLFGHQEAGGEVLVDSNSIAHITGSLFHCDTDLNANNTYDMIKLNAASARLNLTGNNVFIGNGANNWRYAINNAGPSTMAMVTANRLRAATGAWNSAPTMHGGNTLEGLVIPGNFPTTNSYVKTLTDGANVAVDCSQGDVQVLTASASRTMSNPTNITSGSRVTFVFVNSGSSSITHGTSSKYKLKGGVWPTVAGASIQMVTMVSYDGTNLYEESRTDGDI